MAKRQSGFIHKTWLFLWRFILLYTLTLLFFRFVPIPTSSFMLQSHYAVTQKWISIDQLPTSLPLAVVAAEDQRFPVHFGMDFTEIIHAIKQYDDGEGLRGASTISQQTAKNLCLWSGRSFMRKILEAAIATSLEIIWGKKRILEVYLNIAEFGKGIYGVEAASRYYFGKSARHLSRTQSVQLAVLLPNPKQRDPHHLSVTLMQRVVWVKRQMRQLGQAYLNPIINP